MKQIFAGGGEAGELIRSFDWANTPLGPVGSWPQSLIHYVRLILDLPTPAVLFWGPEQTQIYNDGYAVIMGPRHPRYLGAPYRECWPDTYPLIYPWMRKVLDQGEVIIVDKSHITVTRHGYEEEAYFTFTFSPVRDDEGNIAGIYQPVVEVTEAVLGERRAETIRLLEPRADAPDPMRDAIAVLSKNDKDIPFALVYRWDESEKALRPVACTANISSRELRLDRISELARGVFHSAAPLQVEDVPELLGGRHVGPWPEPTRSALFLPISGDASKGPSGVAVLGLSPRLRCDETYRRFLELSSHQVEKALAMSRRKRRDVHLAFLAELSEELSRLLSTDDIMQTVAEKLGAYLKLTSIHFCTVDRAEDAITVDHSWGRGAAPSSAGVRRISEYLIEEIGRASRTEETVVVRDTQSDPGIDARASAELEVGSFVSVPFHEGGIGKALICISDSRPRAWREDELELLQEVASRLFPRIQRARAEMALRESEERLKKAVSIQTVGVLFFKLDGHILDANEALERMSGYRRDELRRIDWKLLTPPEFMDTTMRAARELATVGKTAPYEKQWIRPDGSRWWGLFAPTRIGDDRADSECMEFIIDISSRKRAEAELRERMEFEQQLIGIVSHDLRNPLSAILVNVAGLLRQEELGDRTMKGLVRLQSSAERALRLVQDLLDFTQARLGGGIPVSPQPLDLHALTRVAVEEVHANFPEREIDVRAEGDARGAWDPDRISQLISNLLSNALKYSPAGTIVSVRTRGGDASVELWVHNDGPPIPERAMPRLFEPMQRASSRNDAASRSVGLGLYIVKRIVDAHRGRIEVTSTERDGTTFAVRLPRYPSSTEGIRSADEGR